LRRVDAHHSSRDTFKIVRGIHVPFLLYFFYPQDSPLSSPFSVVPTRLGFFSFPLFLSEVSSRPFCLPLREFLLLSSSNHLQELTFDFSIIRRVSIRISFSFHFPTRPPEVNYGYFCTKKFLGPSLASNLECCPFP